MSLPDPPPLNDLRAADLLARAQARLAALDGDWQATDPADPGRALLEAVAEVVQAELDRLDRLPQAVGVQLMSMLGAQLRPGRAASVTLRFSRTGTTAGAVRVPRGTRVTAGEGEGDVFVTLADLTLPDGTDTADTLAARAIAEPPRLRARGTGLPGQRVRLPDADLPGAPEPVAALDVLVEGGADRPPGAARRTLDGRDFVVYREVPAIDGGSDGAVFAADRVTGEVRFALQGAGMPARNAEIRIGYWRRTGGTDAVAPDSVTRPLDPLPGLSVTNPGTARPERAAETLPERLSAGPVDLLAGGTALTARDFEAIARRAHPGVARAHALTPAADWAFAEPGLVELRIAPRLPDTAAHRPGPEALDAAADPEILLAVTRAAEAAAPLGVRVAVRWLPARAVGLSARVFVSRGADTAAIRARVLDRLGRHLAPVPVPRGAEDDPPGWPDGWPLGRALRQSEMIETLLAVPGVRAVDKVRLVPRHPMQGPVTALSPDPAQPGVWVTAMGGALYLTRDDGQGWVHVALPGDGRAIAAAFHPVRTGLVAAIAEDGAVFVSRECGQRFEPFAQAPPGTDCAAWADGSETPRLLLAGAAPLSETSGPVAGLPGDAPPATRPLLAQDGPVGPAYAIATCPDGRGGRLVAVARRALGGIVLSNDSGWDGGYRPVGLAGHDVRALAFLHGPDGALWLIAGLARPVFDSRASVMGASVDADTGAVGDWQTMTRGWPGGGCASLSAAEGAIMAATRDHGLVTGAMGNGGRLVWRVPAASETALPRADEGGVLRRVAFGPARAGTAPTRLAGGDGMLFAAREGAFAPVALRPGADRIELPHDWTLVGDGHEIDMRHDTD